MPKLQIEFRVRQEIQKNSPIKSAAARPKPDIRIKNDMAVEIKLPSLGEGVESGDVLELLVAEGDQIEKDQGIVEMETDKATVIVPSDFAGKVTKIMVGEGDSVSVGDVIMTIDAVEDESDSKAPAKTEAPAAKVPEPEPAPEPEPEPEPADCS